MRTDFLANRCGDDGIVVIELKKSDQTARQAYTELFAYGSYLRTKFTPMSGGDIIYVLISPVGERIVEQATINTLIYDNNKVCLLVPKYENNDISTLKLELWIPDKKVFKDLSYSCFNKENISWTVRLCGSLLPGEWSQSLEKANARNVQTSQQSFLYCSSNYGRKRYSWFCLLRTINSGICKNRFRHECYCPCRS